MSNPRCLNCDAEILADARFCACCGQRTDTARLSFADMTRDLFHSFVNIERGPVLFAWILLTRPGYMAREYVSGRRRRYYGPFATLAVVAGLTALVLQMSGFHALSQEVSSHSAAMLNRYFNLVLLAQLPILGVLCGVVFKDAHLKLPEHMVLVAYTLCIRAVALIAMVPLALYHSALAPTGANTATFWFVWYAYFGWAASQFYGGARWWSWLRGMITAALGHGTIVGILAVTAAIYDSSTRV